MLQLILHLTGDYLLQNDWMAENKAKNNLKGYIACLMHCIVYTIPWVFACYNLRQCLIIFATHFLIDKYRLPILWIRLKNENWNMLIENYGYSVDTPKWMSGWLFIIVDGTFHMICNYVAIRYF